MSPSSARQAPAAASARPCRPCGGGRAPGSIRGGLVTEGGAGVARPSSLESRAAWGAAAARGGRGAYVAFTDRIRSAVRGETEQTREEMWQEPVGAAGRYF